MNIVWGTANTAVLITSSFTMAMGVWWRGDAHEERRCVLCLVLTFILGLVFLGIKTIEYHEKWEKHHVPGIHYSLQSFLDPASDPEVCKEYHDKPLALDMARHTELYFFLYFAMTGMHALHMIIGIAILGFMIFRAQAGAYTTGHVTFVENFGLYWHFVDIIWIYPLPAAVSDQQASIKDTTRMSEPKHEHGPTARAHPHRQPQASTCHLLALLVGTALTVWASFYRTGHLEPHRRPGHRHHQGHAGRALLHARQVQHQADQAHRGLRASSCSSVLIGMTLADYISRAWGRW